MNNTLASSSKMGIGFGLMSTLVVMAMSGCGTTVGLSSDRYTPLFDAAPLAKYSGKTIVLRTFENVDDNTSFFLYQGAGRRYGGPVLASYFWYCFKKSFAKLGVNVLEDGQPALGVTTMGMSLKHINEAGFTVSVIASGATGQPPLQKDYSIVGPPITNPNDVPGLENRAYAMMSTLFANIVSDPQFQSVVTP
jgi:hypothetical protein